MLAKLPSVSVSVPSPRSTEPLETCAAKVIVSAPVPPISVSTLETEPVLAKSPSVSLSLPAPRSMLSEPVRAVPSVTVSASCAADERLDVRDRQTLAKLPSVSLSEPEPRSIEAFEAAAPSVMVSAPRAADERLDVGDGRRSWRSRPSVRVSAPGRGRSMPFETCVANVIVSAPVPPISVSTFETEPVLSKLPSVSVSLPAPRSMLLELVSSAPSVMVSALLPPMSVSTFETVDVVGEVAERQRVAAVAEIDRALGDLRRERDGVGARAADQRLDVRERAGVGEIAEGQLVVARAEIDAARSGQRRCRA